MAADFSLSGRQRVVGIDGEKFTLFFDMVVDNSATGYVQTQALFTRRDWSAGRFAIHTPVTA